MGIQHFANGSAQTHIRIRNDRCTYTGFTPTGLFGLLSDLFTVDGLADRAKCFRPIGGMLCMGVDHDSRHHVMSRSGFVLDQFTRCVRVKNCPR
ncbi:hypothetical protein D3C76_1398680 [compost metagenome]